MDISNIININNINIVIGSSEFTLDHGKSKKFQKNIYFYFIDYTKASL